MEELKKIAEEARKTLWQCPLGSPEAVWEGIIESACREAIKAFCEREPTVEMYRAVDGKCDAYGFNHKSGKPEVTYETVQSIYKAMMQAALRELGE